MDAAAYEMMARNEDRHWWWSGRRAILGSILDDLRARGALPPGTLYDLGCGVGSNLAVLGRYGDALGLDGSPLAVDAAHALGRSNVRYADLARGLDAIADIPAASGALVLMADVLEHLDDERPALEVARHLLAPGGVFLATVPAFPMLWGPSDTFNHHRRRYTRDTLGAAVSQVFRVERMSYFNAALFPAVAVARALSRGLNRPGAEEIALPPAPLNAALTRLFRAERHVLARADLPFGVSLLCVARRVD
jgi:SAM-dependent methyltransferase